MHHYIIIASANASSSVLPDHSFVYQTAGDVQWNAGHAQPNTALLQSLAERGLHLSLNSQV